MSLVFDVQSVAVDNGPATNFTTTGIIEMTVEVANPVTAFEIEVPNAVATLNVNVPGPQGAPGLQNVYVQSTDPSKDENGNTIWGAEQTNYIWIKV